MDPRDRFRPRRYYRERVRKAGAVGDRDYGDEGIEQMLELAARLRAQFGAVLDENAIQAVSEATGQPTELVRLALKLRADSRQNALESLRAQFLTLEPDVRRYVTTGVAAMLTAFFHALEQRVAGPGSQYGIFDMVALVFLTMGIYNVCVARDAKTSAVAGAILGGGIFAGNSLFRFIMQLPTEIAAFALVPAVGLGAVAGVLLHRLVSKFRPQLGLTDPVEERQALLRQLVDIQDRLRADEHAATFLSVDIVGSTRMKEIADPLAVEYTFTQYHEFVERIVRKVGGRVHSTAGDGMTCAFEHPQQAFGAARTIQSGLIELNTFRNKVGVPIVVRQAVHTGKVLRAEGADIRSVNFAHVIDIAAHLQKLADPGTVAVSDASAAFLPGGPAEIGTDKVRAGDIGATIWRPRAALPATEGGPPPAPTAPTTD